MFCLIASCEGCQSRPLSPADVGPDRVEGTLRLRDGATFPKGAKVRVVVRWYDTPLADRVIDPIEAWPVRFAVPVKWPYGKGSPTSSVEVHARAELNGRTVMVSETLVYSYYMKPVDLVLLPAIE